MKAKVRIAHLPDAPAPTKEYRMKYPTPSGLTLQEVSDETKQRARENSLKIRKEQWDRDNEGVY